MTQSVLAIGCERSVRIGIADGLIGVLLQGLP